MNNLASIVALAWALLCSHTVWAQAPGQGTMTVVIPFAPGGASDIIVRELSEPLGKATGRSVLVDNRGGGGGLIAAQAVARSAAEAHMLLYGNQGQSSCHPASFPTTSSIPKPI